MHLHIHHHADQRVIDKLDLLLATGELIMDSIDRLIDDVAKQKTVTDSTLALIQNLKNQVADALSGTKLPPAVEARLAAIFPDLESNTDRLTTAITDNTPAAPAPTSDPTPAPVDTAPSDPAPAPVDGGSTNPAP